MEGCVPVSAASSSPVCPNSRPLIADEDIRELLWQDGHPVVRSHRASKNWREPSHVGDGDSHLPKAGEVGGQTLINYDGLRLFMQEDEEDAWLHSDDHFYRTDFLRLDDVGPSESSISTRESMLVDAFSVATIGSSSVAGGDSGWRSLETVTTRETEIATMARIPEPPAQRPRSAQEYRKRAGGAGLDEAECDSEDAKLGAANAKKPRCGQAGSMRRSRSAEVHNRSERKRRDRINEKIKELQDLIPRSGKVTDKAATLDCAIEYLKTLQQQLQMMASSMGRGMVLTSYPCLNTVAPPPSAAAAIPYITSHHVSHLQHCWESGQTDHQSGQAIWQPGMQNPVQLHQHQQQLPVHPSLAWPYQLPSGFHQAYHSQY
ncbi:hypothetical protein SAY86_015493 [Trapa natans]|uniref:BHLH domain-containing protein n=1 Tax=Trapa natans TaxID=22666 RepID=A0AAN7L8N6_TRANT|nr:hypothetical protein SAY86_015493 [Trapa natans]